MPPGWSGSVFRTGVSRGLKRSRLRRPSSLDLPAVDLVVAALLHVDLATLGPLLRARHPRTPPRLTVKGSLRSGGVYPSLRSGPPALDCEPRGAVFVREQGQGPKSGPDPADGSRAIHGARPPLARSSFARCGVGPEAGAHRTGRRPTERTRTSGPSPRPEMTPPRKWNPGVDAPPDGETPGGAFLVTPDL